MNRLLVLIVYTYTCLSSFFCVVVESLFLFKTSSLRAVDIEKYPVLLFVSSEVSSESNFGDIDIESINKDDDDDDISTKIFRTKVCLIDDNEQYHNECQELSISLDLPMLTELPNSELDDNPFDHILKLVPYESDMISTFALAIQALPQHHRQQQENAPSRRRKSKRKKQQPVTLPFYVDLCPSKQSKIGKRTSNNGSQKQQKSGGGSDLLLKATGIIKKKQQGKQGQSSVVDDRGDDNDDEVIVYDLTAGFGQDSLVMAMTGRFNHVIMVERDPVVAALLQDALRRIDLLASLLPDDSDDGEVIKGAKMVSKCLSLVIGDSTELFIDNNNGPLLTKGHGKQIQLRSPDVVYLDPMFPPRTKSAAVKKNMQILHGLLDTQKQKQQIVTETKNGDSTKEQQQQQQQHNTQLEEIRLLNTALQIAQSRVVVKRPIKASSLGCDSSSSLSSFSPPTPSYSVKGSTSRWDVYLK